METTLRPSPSPRPVIIALLFVGVILIGFALVLLGPDWLALVGGALMFVALTVATFGRQWWAPRAHHANESLASSQMRPLDDSEFAQPGTVPAVQKARAPRRQSAPVRKPAHRPVFVTDTDADQRQPTETVEVPPPGRLFVFKGGSLRPVSPDERGSGGYVVMPTPTTAFGRIRVPNWASKDVPAIATEGAPMVYDAETGLIRFLNSEDIHRMNHPREAGRDPEGQDPSPPVSI